MRSVGIGFLAFSACSGGSGGGTDVGTPPPPAQRCVAPDFYAPVTAAVAYEQTEFDGWPVVQWVPSGMQGLIFYFHGSGGNAAQLVLLEPMGAANVMVGAGFGIVATDSELRGSEAFWSDEEDWDANPDFQRLEAIRDDLIASGKITASTPIYTMGFSNGGFMSSLFAAEALEQGWPIGAAGPHNSVPWGASDGLPMFIAESVNDESIAVDSARGFYEDWVSAGWPAEFRLTEEAPLDPLRLMRIPGFTEEIAGNAFTELQTFGLVDAAGERLIDLADLESELTHYENSAQMMKAWEVSAELRVQWATHRYDNQFAAEECQFFVDHPPAGQ
jgi:predicted esterase